MAKKKWYEYILPAYELTQHHDNWYEYIPGYNIASGVYNAFDHGIDLVKDNVYQNSRKPGYNSGLVNKINNALTLPSSVVDKLPDKIQEVVGHKDTTPDTSLVKNVDDVLDDYINKGYITESDVNAYVNNLFTGDLDYQRNLEMLEKNQAFNSAEAEKNRVWQTNMSNTALTRQMADLRANGFNPALALGTSGANVMSVQNASSSGSNTPVNTALANILSSAVTANSGLASSALGTIGKIVSAIVLKK